MKNKKQPSDMAKLGRKMVIWFLVITVIAGTVNNILEVIFDSFAPDFIEKDNHLFLALMALFIAAEIGIYVASGFVFFLLTKKNIRKESERQMQEKDLIYAAIAHDLKTPMTSVQGFAKALSEGRVKPEEQQEIFDIICRKSESMNEMVNTLFEYAKLGAEHYKPHMEQINLCTLVRNSIAENYTEFEEHGIELEIDIPNGEIMLSGDQNELKRAITNLIVNIYRHNPGGIKARITVCEENGRGVIRISDSDHEIPDGINIFEPFVTENASRTAGQGTGLGLAVTKRIVELHGGSIAVEKGADGYTKTFVIRL